MGRYALNISRRDRTRSIKDRMPCEWNVNVQFGIYSHPNFASKSSVDWTSPKVTRNLPSV